jgi:hypothetical protein
MTPPLRWPRRSSANQGRAKSLVVGLQCLAPCPLPLHRARGGPLRASGSTAEGSEAATCKVVPWAGLLFCVGHSDRYPCRCALFGELCGGSEAAAGLWSSRQGASPAGQDPQGLVRRSHSTRSVGACAGSDAHPQLRVFPTHGAPVQRRLRLYGHGMFEVASIYTSAICRGRGNASKEGSRKELSPIARR